MFTEAVRSIAVLYDGLVVPGALLLLGSGTWYGKGGVTGKIVLVRNGSPRESGAA